MTNELKYTVVSVKGKENCKFQYDSLSCARGFAQYLEGKLYGVCVMRNKDGKVVYSVSEPINNSYGLAA